MPCSPCAPENVPEPVAEKVPEIPQEPDDKPRVSFAADQDPQSHIERQETPVAPARNSESSVSTVSSIEPPQQTAEKVEQAAEVVEEQIEEELIQEEMIQPIQRGVSTDSDKIGGVTLDEYEQSKKIAMDHFITETTVPEGTVI